MHIMYLMGGTLRAWRFSGTRYPVPLSLRGAPTRRVGVSRLPRGDP